MNVISLVALAATLFIIIALSQPLAARLRLPFTVILALMGMLIGGAAAITLTSDLTDALNPAARAILELPIRANVFLYVFLPTLLFQVALKLNLRRMLDDWVPILTLAVVAVLVATLAVGYALAWVSAIPLVVCLLIGAIVSTTDPSAVVSIFRDISAPRRLTRIVEGESLLNDAAAIALFGVFLTFVMRGVPDPTLSEAIGQVPVLVLGGALTGWLLARVWLTVMCWLPNHPLAQVTLSVALPYLAYIGAEQGLAASGVIAVVAAGMTLNLTGPGRLSPGSWAYLREVWDLLAHWSGSLIFVLAALLIPRLLGDVQWSDLGLVATVTGAAIAARVVILFGLLPLLRALWMSPQIEVPFRIAILWGGLRGAVTLALALAVTESPLVADETKRIVGILATGFTLFTLLVQGTTLRWMIRRLRLNQLGPLDSALSNQVIAVALQNVREAVSETARSNILNHDTVRSEAKTFGERLETARRSAEAGAAILDRDRITLGLVALAGRERDLILEHFRQQILSTRLVERMLSDADRLIERTRIGGRTEYRRAGRLSLGEGRDYRFVVFLHNRLGISWPLARLSADRFEMILNQRMILSDLHSYIDGKIRRIHGKRVADLLHEVLERREEAAEASLEGMRLQFPGYSEQLERRFIRRTALRLEEREYDQLLADGLIGAELHTRLMTRIARDRTRTEKRPTLDLAVQKTELVRRFPLFREMDESARKRLARALVTVYAAPGDVLFRRGDEPRRIFFIASGAVEMEWAGHKQRLGRGDMFGQLAMLKQRRRQAQVTAITPCILLTLDEIRFRRLLQRHKTLQQAVRESARKRGFDLEDEIAAEASPPKAAE